MARVSPIIVMSVGAIHYRVLVAHFLNGREVQLEVVIARQGVSTSALLPVDHQLQFRELLRGQHFLLVDLALYIALLFLVLDGLVVVVLYRPIRGVI